MVELLIGKSSSVQLYLDTKIQQWTAMEAFSIYSTPDELTVYSNWMLISFVSVYLAKLFTLRLIPPLFTRKRLGMLRTILISSGYNTKLCLASLFKNKKIYSFFRSWESKWLRNCYLLLTNCYSSVDFFTIGTFWLNGVTGSFTSAILTLHRPFLTSRSCS